MILRPVRPASPMGPPIDEAAGRVHVHDRVGCAELGRDRRQDHVLDDLLAEALRPDIGVVLGGHDHGPHAGRPAMLVLDRDLRLAVRAEVRELAGLAGLGQAARHPVCQRDREGHELRRLTAGEPEHHPLVAGAELVDLDLLAADLEGGVHAERDVRRLLLDRDEGAARLVVEAVVRARVTDVADGLTNDLLEVDVGGRRDLAEDDHQAGRRGRLAGDPGIRVVAQDRVQDRVADLVAHLVRVTLGHRFRGEQVVRRVDDAGHSALAANAAEGITVGPPGHREAAPEGQPAPAPASVQYCSLMIASSGTPRSRSRSVTAWIIAGLPHK